MGKGGVMEYLVIPMGSLWLGMTGTVKKQTISHQRNLKNKDVTMKTNGILMEAFLRVLIKEGASMEPFVKWMEKSHVGMKFIANQPISHTV